MTTRTQTDRSKDQYEGQQPQRRRRCAWRWLALNRKNIQIAFEMIRQDRPDIAALEDLSSVSAAKDLADQDHGATDAGNGSKRGERTDAIHRLGQRAERRGKANQRDAAGRRTRPRPRKVRPKEYEKLGPLAKELASVEGKRNEGHAATRRTASASRSRKWKTATRPSGVVRTTMSNSLADAQAERALELVADRPHEGRAGPHHRGTDGA